MHVMDLKTYIKTAERGAAARVAEHVGVHPVMVSQWASGTKPVPAERCPAIERATEGAVKADEMRADVVWVRIPDPDWPHPQGRPCIDAAAPAAREAA